MRFSKFVESFKSQYVSVTGLASMLARASKVELYALLGMMVLGAFIPYLRWAAFGPLAAKISRPSGSTAATFVIYVIFLATVLVIELFLRKLMPAVRSHAAQQASSLVSQVRLKLGLSSFQSGPMQQQVQDAEDGKYNLPFVVPEQLELALQTLTLLIGVSIIGWYSPFAGIILAVSITVAVSFGVRSVYRQHMADLENWPKKGELTTTERFMTAKESMRPVLLFGISAVLVSHVQRLAVAIQQPIRNAIWGTLKVDLIAAGLLLFGMVIALYFVVGLKGTVTSGTVIFLCLTTVSTATSYQRLVESFGKQVLGGAKVRSLFELLASNLNVDGEDGVAELPESAPAAIELRGLSFTYPGGTIPVLDGLSASFHPGEVTYLLGRNGVGKSTVLSVLGRLYPVPSNQVFIGGVDIATVKTSSLRRYVAQLAQDTLNMRYTIRRTLAFAAGLDDPTQCCPTQCSDAMMWQALTSACLAGDVQRFSNQLDEPLGAFAKAKTDLSGGQMKKLNLAMFFMAILSGRTKIAILDEPFNNIDQESAATIMEKIRSLKVTTIIVTHGVDRIPSDANVIFLDRAPNSAATAVCGTHSDLLKTNDSYRRYCAAPSVKAA